MRLSPGLRHMLWSTLFFSAMSVFAKIAGQRLPTMEIVLGRVVVTLVMSWWAIRAFRLYPWGNDKRLLMVRGFCGFMGLSCYFYSVSHLPLADAVVIQFCNPMLTAVIAALVLGERMRWQDWLGTLSSLVGVALVAQPSFLFATGEPLDPLTVSIAITGAIFSACAYVVIRKLGKTENPYIVVFYFPLVAGPLAVPVLAVEGLVMPTPLEWLLLLGVGVGAQLGQIQMTKGFKLESAGRASAMTYLQIVLAFVWGLLLFNETPNLLSVFGAILVVLSIFSVVQRKY